MSWTTTTGLNVQVSLNIHVFMQCSRNTLTRQSAMNLFICPHISVEKLGKLTIYQLLILF